MKKLLLALFLCLLPVCSWAANGDITACRIKGTEPGNGFVLQCDIAGFKTGGAYSFGLGTNNDPSTAKVVLTVTSPKVDPSDDSVTTATRTVYGTQWFRKLYPNQLVANETDNTTYITVEMALSDNIYSDDTVTVTISGSTSGVYQDTGTGGSNAWNNAVTDKPVTNNSTLDYSTTMSVGRWAIVPYELVSTSSYDLEAVVFNRFGQNGKPLNAVKFTCVDEHAHTSTATATNMTVSSWGVGDANKVLVYKGTIDNTGFTTGDIITCNFKAYPWIGDDASILNSDLVANGGSGYAQPDERLGPFEYLYSTSAYGGFAVVDTTNGQDSAAATWVVATQADAEAAYGSSPANSYKTMARAQAAIKAYNNATYSHNDAGGGVILLSNPDAPSVSNYDFPGATADAGTMKTWLIIRPMSTVAKAQAVINANGSGWASFTTQKLKLQGFTVDSTALFQIVGRSTDVVWIHDMAIDRLSGAEPFSVWGGSFTTQNRFGAVGAVSSWGFYGSSDKAPNNLLRGNTFDVAVACMSMYCAIGNVRVNPLWCSGTNCAGQQKSDNMVYAFNTQMGLSGPVSIAYADDITHGIALVQNVLEKMSAPDELLSIDGASRAATNNVILWHNTLAGERQLMGYNDDSQPSAELQSNWSQIGNIWDSWNTKGDEFGVKKTVTGITKANPGVVTAEAHGYADGESVYVEGITGDMAALNGTTQTVANATTSTFEIQDTSSFASACSSGCGTVTTQNPARTGSMSVRYNVGSSGNLYRLATFPGEFDGLNSYRSGTTDPAYRADYSKRGTGAGNGDYHVNSNSKAVNLSPNGRTVLPYDLDGKRRRTEADDAGAYTRGLPKIF